MNRDLEDTDVEFLRALVAAQPDGESAVQAIIADRLRSAGCSVEEVTYNPGEVELVEEFAADAVSDGHPRTAILGRLSGRADRASLLLFAHPDAEPVADLAAWRHPPFEGHVEQGRLYGWGVADDLAGCAAAVLAVEAAAQERDLGEVVFASVPSKRHAKGVAAMLHRGLRADAALYLHPAESGRGMGEIKAVASGQLEFRLTVRGRQPDTTEPIQTGFTHLAVNPVDKAVLLHGALMALSEKRAHRVRHPLIEAEVGRATNLHVSAFRAGNPARPSRLSETCEFYGAVAFPPGQSLGDVIAEIQEALLEASRDDPWLRDNPPHIDWLSGVAAAEVSREHPLWQTSAKAIERTAGRRPIMNPMHTTSDIRNPIVQAGIPCVGLGCLGGDLSQNGRHDEWVDLADFARMVDVASDITRTWCGREVS